MEYTEKDLFRYNLIRILQENGWSQKTLAEKTGIAESEISRIVNGCIPLTTDRLSKICSSLDILANEFYRKDIIVEDRYSHISVRLDSTQPQVKTFMKRKSRYEKKKYRFTELQMHKLIHDVYYKGYDDGRMSSSEHYEFPDEKLMMVAEELSKYNN